MTQILDGKVVRDEIAKNLKAEISRLRSKPKLVIIQVGDLAESNTYIGQKIKFGEKIGAVVRHLKTSADVSQENLKSKILNLNSDKSVHGIIIQQPLPRYLDKDKLIDAIDPVKDVDGQTATNIKLLFEGHHNNVILEIRRLPETPESDSGQARMTSNHGYIPATTKGVLALLDYYKITIAGKKVVVVGRSSLVGKPTALAFLNRDATVTVCHSKSSDLSSITKTADILVVAAGKPKLIIRDYVSKNQVVVDVGISVISDKQQATRDKNNKPETEVGGYKLVGDVDFENVKNIVAAISPVPGGVGPMTVASLFENLFEAYRRQTK